MTISICKKKYSAKEIARDIEEYIIEACLKSDTALTIPRKLAQKYNVSAITVNRAISILVENGLVYRIKGKGSFVARQKLAARNKLVGYFTWLHNDHTPLNEAAYGTFESNLIDELEEFGINVEFLPKASYSKDILSSSSCIKYDLLIIPGGMVTAQTLPWLERLIVPIIITPDAQILPYPFNQVVHYYDLGFTKMLSFLQKKGEKNIFIASVEGETSQTRADVLRKVADKMGIPHETLPFKSHWLSTETSLTFLAGREQGKHFLDNNLDGVIFALSDFIALGIIDVVKERKLKLGKDVKIVSYDNLESRAPLTSGDAIITSITHPLLELVQQTAKLANDIIDNDINDLGITKIVKVPAREFVIRKSFY